MLNVLVGCVLGFLSGLGIGGGSLLMLWLTLGLGMAPQTAREINLLFFLPAAAVACLFRWKQGHLKPKKLLPAMVAGAVSGAVFTFLGQRLDTKLLKKGFGVLLMVTGVRELRYRSKK